MRRLKKRGQSTAEYAILIGVVVAALIAMQTLVGKAIKAKIYDAAKWKDPDTMVAFPTNFYGAGEVTGSDMTVERTGNTREYMEAGADSGKVTRVLTGDQVDRTGNQTQTYNVNP